GRRRRRGRRLLRDRHRVEGSPLPRALHRDPDRASRRSLRSARRRSARHVMARHIVPGHVMPALVFFALAGLAPLVVRDAFLLDGLVLILLWGTARAGWHVWGGYAGHISLALSVFFGLGAYGQAIPGMTWNVSP